MKVNELVRKLASSKAGLAMLEEADRRDKQMVEDERQATENAAIIARRPALAEQLAESETAVREKMDEIISRHKAEYQQLEEMRGEQVSVHSGLAACDRAELEQRRSNRKRFPLLVAFSDQVAVVARHVPGKHRSPFNLDAQKALKSFREDRIGADHYKFGPLREKLELYEVEAKKGLAIEERLAAARQRIGELELEVMPDVQGELEKLAEQIGEVLLPCCPRPKVALPPSTEGVAMGRSVAA